MELLVVSVIILLISTYILFQQSRFNSTTVMRSLTYSVALSMRQAQVYGTSVRGAITAQANCVVGTYQSGSCFTSGYGVHIPSAGASSNFYYQFADLNGNGVYNAGEELPLFRLGSGYRIQSLCAVLNGGSTCTTPTSLTIYFRRPDPDACIAINGGNTCDGVTPQAYSRAYVTIGNSGNSDTRSIKITNTGQIAVCAPNLADVTTC
jgi:hypothetical protein